MLLAALLPAFRASMSVAGPVTQSPPANILVASVELLAGSALMVPQAVVSDPFSLAGRSPRSGFWPVAAITMSVFRVNSEPLMGMGRLRPLSSGSPSFIFTHSIAVTLPALRTIPMGAVR